MGPEGPHAENGPDEIHVESQPEQHTPHIPERQNNFWSRFRNLIRRRPNQDAQEAATEHIAQMDEDRARVRSDLDAAHRPERAAQPEDMLQVNNAEEAVELMTNITAAGWHQRELNARYGQGAGVEANQENFTNIHNWMNPAWRAAAMAGEYDFRMDQDGQIQHDVWTGLMGITRRTIRTLTNRQVLITAGLTTVVAVATGGIGLPAAAALAGGIAGRGIGEAWEAFGGRRVRSGGQRLNLREVATRRGWEEHGRLHEMAVATETEEITDVERNHRIENFVNAYHDVNEEVVQRQREQLEEDTDWNKRRDVCAKIGAAGGMVAGFAGIAHQIMTMDIDGDGIKHLVENTHKGWQYAYNTFEEAAKAHYQAMIHNNPLATGFDAAGRAIHALGGSTLDVIWGAMKNLAPHIAQAGAVAAGLFLGRAAEKRGEVGRSARFEQEVADQRRESDIHTGFLAEQVPGHGQPFENRTPEARWTEMFGRADRLPKGNQVWVVRQPGAAPIIYRLNTVNMENGLATATQVDQNFNPMMDQNDHPIINNQLHLDQLARFGWTNFETVAVWSEQFSKGDHINLTNIPIPIFDANNRQIPNEPYEVIIRPKNPGNAILRRRNANDVVVPIFQLAINGINRYQPTQPEQVTPAERPVVNHVWHVRNHDLLPTELHDYLEADNFLITLSNDHEIVVQSCDANGVVVAPSGAINISNEQWQQMQEAINTTPIRGRAPQSGNQGQNQGGGGGGNRGGGGNQGGGNPGGAPGGTPGNHA